MGKDPPVCSGFYIFTYKREISNLLLLETRDFGAAFYEEVSRLDLGLVTAVARMVLLVFASASMNFS